ncbi:type II toxin-antitoxin system RelE/ParE family toxin [Microbaculum marinum]|uniref:Type II toxin-antitoxin system RelE/ParE family toxin n=1 Tax=Microbaculum marinum TaxID=1764581 RepID=A0AAW9RW13_9HYPH
MKSDTSGINPAWVRRVVFLLDAVDAAKSPEQLALTGAGFHALKGRMEGRYAMTVTRNWRLTFGWDGENAVDVDLEDYHG